MPQGKTRQNNFSQKNPSLRPNDNFSLKRAMRPTYNPYISLTDPKKQFISKIEQGVRRQLQPIKDQLVPPTISSVENEYDVTRGGLNNLPPGTPQPVDNLAKKAAYDRFWDEQLKNMGTDNPFRADYEKYKLEGYDPRIVLGLTGSGEQMIPDYLKEYKGNIKALKDDYKKKISPTTKPTAGPSNPQMRLF